MWNITGRGCSKQNISGTCSGRTTASGSQGSLLRWAPPPFSPLEGSQEGSQEADAKGVPSVGAPRASPQSSEGSAWLKRPTYRLSCSGSMFQPY